METDKQLIGRPHGGVAVLWRKSLGSNCKVVNFNDNRLLGIELNNGHQDMLFVNVYLPYCCDENMEDYLYYMAKVDSLLSDYHSPFVFIIGDFNAHITCSGHNGHKFGEQLLNFCQTENITISDTMLLPVETYAYRSEV